MPLIVNNENELTPLEILIKSNPGKTLRVIIYCRVSTEKQEEDGYSLQEQEAECLFYVQQYPACLTE